eukprot:6054768-Pyramimonas_sp.AAC.1
MLSCIVVLAWLHTALIVSNGPFPSPSLHESSTRGFPPTLSSPPRYTTSSLHVIRPPSGPTTFASDRTLNSAMLDTFSSRPNDFAISKSTSRYR